MYVKSQVGRQMRQAELVVSFSATRRCDEQAGDDGAIGHIKRRQKGQRT